MATEPSAHDKRASVPGVGVVVVEWLYYSKRIIIVRWADLVQEQHLWGFFQVRVFLCRMRMNWQCPGAVLLLRLLLWLLVVGCWWLLVVGCFRSSLFHRAGAVPPPTCSLFAFCFHRFCVSNCFLDVWSRWLLCSLCGSEPRRMKLQSAPTLGTPQHS